MDYKHADELLQGRNKQRRKIGNNTYLERHGDGVGCISIRLHDTDIIRLYPDGSIMLDSGGWRTVTTKARINEFAPLGVTVYQKSGLWYVQVHGGEPMLFKDGMRVSVIGRISGAEPIKSEDKARKLRKRVTKYSKAYIAALKAGKVKLPGASDCFYCYMRVVDTNVPLGESTHNTEHILSHIKENYFVPSLLMRAVEVFPVGELVALGIYTAMVGKPEEAFGVQLSSQPSVIYDYAYRSLRRYLLRQLGQAA